MKSLAPKTLSFTIILIMILDRKLLIKKNRIQGQLNIVPSQCPSTLFKRQPLRLDLTVVFRNVEPGPLGPRTAILTHFAARVL